MKEFRTKKYKKTNLYIYSKFEGGHRREYIEFAKKTFNGEETKHPILKKRTVIFLMIEENFIYYVLTAIARTFLRRKTIGLLFRTAPAAYGKSLKHRTKRTMLKLIKKSNYVNTIAITPLDNTPKAKNITNGWIYDFQMWDLYTKTNECKDNTTKYNILKDDRAKTLHRKIKSASNNKNILIMLGAQNKSKGLRKIVELAQSEEANNLHIFIGGKVDEENTKEKSLLIDHGVQIEDRHLTHNEMLAAYAAADAVWCAYEPEYDQASGIFGRAIQLECLVIVRKGSILESICITNKLNHISIDFEREILLHEEIKHKTKNKIQSQNASTENMRQYSLNILNEIINS